MLPNSPVQKSDIKIDRQTSTKPDGSHTEKLSLSLATEDVIAVFAGVVAVIAVVAMVAGWMAVNKLTIGLASFSGAGAVVAQIIKAKRSKK